ncbi:hypothetical protein D3C76_1629760 [compost metagenome]
MTSRTVPAKGDAGFIHAKSVRVLPDQICASFSIIMSSGEGMFGSQSVLHRNHPTVAVIRQLTQLGLVGIKTATDKTPAMIINNGGQRFRRVER